MHDGAQPGGWHTPATHTVDAQSPFWEQPLWSGHVGPHGAPHATLTAESVDVTTFVVDVAPLSNRQSCAGAIGCEAIVTVTLAPSGTGVGNEAAPFWRRTSESPALSRSVRVACAERPVTVAASVQTVSAVESGAPACASGDGADASVTEASDAPGHVVGAGAAASSVPADGGGGLPAPASPESVPGAGGERVTPPAPLHADTARTPQNQPIRRRR